MLSSGSRLSCISRQIALASSHLRGVHVAYEEVLWRRERERDPDQPAVPATVRRFVKSAVLSRVLACSLVRGAGTCFVRRCTTTTIKHVRETAVRLLTVAYRNVELAKLLKVADGPRGLPREPRSLDQHRERPYGRLYAAQNHMLHREVRKRAEPSDHTE
jgi:hypothetical protein